jgi:hypothetical protein
VHGLANTVRLPRLIGDRSSWLGYTISWTVDLLSEGGEDALGYYGSSGLGEVDELGETAGKLRALLAQLQEAPQPTTEQVRCMVCLTARV